MALAFRAPSTSLLRQVYELIAASRRRGGAGATAEIRRSVPGWTVWSKPCPGGETPDEVQERLDRVIARVRAAAGPVLVFGHGHALRALTARWLDLPVTEGRLFRLDTATVSVLGHERECPVVLRWNS